MTMKFPLVEDTLGKKLEAGTGLSVDCLTCNRKAVLDVAELVKRFGPDQPCLHWDLVKLIFCHECRSAGRDDRNLQFTNQARMPESVAKPRDDQNDHLSRGCHRSTGVRQRRYRAAFAIWWATGSKKWVDEPSSNVLIPIKKP
ncbi:hypothetical protein GCM10010869_74860 [Mesorhizobium tianshanense]|uniref:Uncharacterized protein n=1 Tax=Mesorhizobium tianshanense TaxID=39844 RepID=A0A562P7H9_9HYPH|nr:hypothetical protein [Mesorhizobium tianshanense]TWI40351.1 hypothetical protein IQ26_01548 [Mesorhizobium tianshanense]GLS41889.1 hypothetical protein GCM10010869_74860 [Mesorhizobium tianshanense]